jgi:membrane-associated phospholipid phosphatase
MIVVVVGMSRSQSARRLLAGVAAVSVVAVALSRLYLGVHWLTDVLAGALLASAVVAVGATALHGAVRHKEAEAPKTAADRAPRTAVL